MKHAASLRDHLSDWQGQSVLIVDDDEGVVHFLRRALASRCGLVETAPDLASAAAIQSRVHFDLILPDVMLPDGSGIDWLADLQRTAFSGDVVLLTAFVDLESSLAALRSGAADILLKPFRLDQLLVAAGRCFDRARLAREHVALRRGTRQTLGVTADVYTYAMSGGGETLYVVLNRGDGASAAQGLPSGNYRDLLTGDTLTAPVQAPARTGLVLQPM